MRKIARKYIGLPCPHGHGGIRYVRSDLCVRCEELRYQSIKRGRIAAAGLSYSQLEPWDLITRAQACHAGLIHYDGKPCPHGHSGRRYVKGGACVECSTVATRNTHRAIAKAKRKPDAEELRLENRELDKRFDALQKARRDASQQE
jgi:hypothetical protein